ncbi:MAG: Asp-tRNA(Asn)/Glu-tRNA(Gln) amidotransferase subunit GatC [Verrucomicrobia bacterium]|nr:Asp-tRNA(Asn)/Glu-tRNA(Gln) amidotransferase subunit GatC [Verrucomicrobiota bacterium]MBU4292037.1 Asp-tRNA(Asn)/Glu-tRNA(Gln) amidotransferase subunit GatC [Verrucomicrobiota bacterium]MBU4427925.1 Asp-tRNA(Asn)/Glu-tRNA(Gln) amidotransferase subunit GatC [Verrucomicrobiota bacterium]MCG2678871.1 Asp-tRNA(Asn)/Glu-tRNA(Gln) amidotransferase subunit GatC [Kiritimatiellia bacterium]
MVLDSGRDAVKTIDVPYVAHLARLTLDDKEIRDFQGQLDQIVAYVKIIQQVDVSGVEPMAHAVQIRNVFRKDEERKGLDRDVVLANAPVHDGEQFLVPKIV